MHSRVCFNRWRENLVLEVLNQNSNNGIKRSPALWTGLTALLTLPCFSLWIRFLLCWAFLLTRLILPGFSCLFWHRFKFNVSELFTHRCTVFLPFLTCSPFRRGNFTAIVLVNKDMSIKVNQTGAGLWPVPICYLNFFLRNIFAGTLRFASIFFITSIAELYLKHNQCQTSPTYHHPSLLQV